jgi:signal transduction histidine kinase
MSTTSSNADGVPVGRTSGPARFQLVRWFAVLSLLSISFASVLTAIVLSKFLSEQMLYREAQVMTDFINGVIEVERADTANANSGDWIEGDVEEFFYHIGGMPGVVKANVFRPDGQIMWSTDASIIGQRFDRNDELDAAFIGNPATHVDEMEAPGESAKDEHAFLRLSQGDKFIESYLPLWDAGGDRSKIVGVVEIYYAPKQLFAMIDAGVRRVWLSALIGGAIIYIALFWVVSRAARTINQQQQELLSNEMLAAVGEMASAVAHSLRNPLSSVRSSAELALVTDDADRKKAALTDILSDTDRLETWIRQYLADTQAEIGRDSVADVDAVIRQTLKHFHTVFERKGIRASTSVSGALPPVRPSSLTLIQVLTSLVANAVEAMPSGGQLNISASAENGGEQVKIAFEDTGVGLTPGASDLAFKPFATTKNSGFGLGLPLARRVVARYGGRITLGNRPDGGAVATLLLPSAV